MNPGVYMPRAASGYEWVSTANLEDQDTFMTLDGAPRRDGWKPVRVTRVSEDRGVATLPAAFPWLASYAIVVRRTVVEALGDMLSRCCEVLPLGTDDGVELFVLNTFAIDALDEQASSIMRIPGTNRIMYIERHVFIDTRIRDADMFRLPYRASATYVSEKFVSRVTGAGLSGLDFARVWPSEPKDAVAFRQALRRTLTERS